MLADPQSVTVAGNAISLPRTGVNGNLADYMSADGTTSLRIQQSTTRNTKRTSVILRTAKIAADPITGLNSRVTATWSVTCSQPLDGFTITELKDQLVGLATALTASSAAMTTKVLGGEK